MVDIKGGKIFSSAEDPPTCSCRCDQVELEFETKFLGMQLGHGCGCQCSTWPSEWTFQLAYVHW